MPPVLPESFLTREFCNLFFILFLLPPLSFLPSFSSAKNGRSKEGQNSQRFRQYVLFAAFTWLKFDIFHCVQSTS